MFGSCDWRSFRGLQCHFEGGVCWGSFWVFGVRVCDVFGVRVCAVLPSVPVVNVPLSSVNVVCEVVSSDSHCESVEQQTYSLARETRGVFCGKTRTNEYWRNTGESTASNQKKGYRAHSSAKSAAAT